MEVLSDGMNSPRVTAWFLLPALIGLTALLTACDPPKPPPRSPTSQVEQPQTPVKSEWLVAKDTVQKWLQRANEAYEPVPQHPDGRTWVVSSSGQSGAEGSAEAPLGLIAEALEKAQPGDRVLVKAGTYSETIRFPKSGEEGKPIILEGERGPEGEWLSFIDLGQPITGWTSAPEVGPGVYKRSAEGNPPYCLTNDGKQILRIHDRLMELPWDSTNPPAVKYSSSLYQDGVSGFYFLTLPPDGKIGSLRQEDSIQFWDGIEAIYGVKDDTIYLRFRDGRDPNKENLRGAPAGTALAIEDQSHLVVRNMAIRGAEYGLVISGPKAAYNVVESNSFQHGRDRITLTKRAPHNLIRDNDVTLNFYGSDHFGLSLEDDAEAAEEGKDPLETPQSKIRLGLYRAFKHIQGTDASADIGIRIQTAGTGNRIVGNHIYNGLKGLHCMGAPDLVVSGNVIHNMSSLCVVTLPGLWNAHFHDNLYFDSNIILRIHQYNTPAKRSEFHYRNVFRLPEQDGRHVYVHYNNAGHEFGPDDEPVIGFYHNTLIGGVRGLVCGSFRRGIGMTKTVVLNNIISTANEPVSYFRAFPGRTAPEGFDGQIYQVFDYNWIGGRRADDNSLPKWFGANNINAPNQQLWPADYQGPLSPPQAVQGKGIDLSKSFTISGKTYEPLPGMYPGYFRGPAPDLGALQWE